MEKLDVKVGDKLIAWGRTGKRIGEVTKITPTGRIRINGSSAQFSPDGLQLGDSGWYGTSLHPYDEEIVKQIQEDNVKQNAIYRMQRVSTSLAGQISLEDARTINRILLSYERGNR